MPVEYVARSGASPRRTLFAPATGRIGGNNPLLGSREIAMSYASSSRAPHAGQRASQGAGLLGGLGRGCYRHRWVTLFTWVIGVACLIALWLQFGAAALTTFNSTDPGQTVLN